MKGVCSLRLNLGHTGPPWKTTHELRRILSALFGSVHFELGYVGDSARVRIVRSFLFGLYRPEPWEVLGPPESTHRLPNGSTAWIGRQKPGTANNIPLTTVQFEEAGMMYSVCVPIATPAQ